MKRWTFSYESASVFEVECEKHGYPHNDEHGECQYDNTHFDTEEEAREKLLEEAKAGVSLASSRRKQDRKSLEESTRILADAAEILAKVMKAEEVSRG